MQVQSHRSSTDQLYLPTSVLMHGGPNSMRFQIMGPNQILLPQLKLLQLLLLLQWRFACLSQGKSTRGANNMEAGNEELGLNNESGTQLEALQKEHEEKTARIRELKQQIEATKAQLEKRKSEVPNEKIQAFLSLRDKYDKLREEYNALLLPRER